MSKTTKMAVLEETKARLENRIQEIKSIVWGPSPWSGLLDLRRRVFADIKGKTTEELITPKWMEYFKQAADEEKKFQDKIEAQKDSNALIEELVTKEMELGDINNEIWRENRGNH